jgi:hypothetical protein
MLTFSTGECKIFDMKPHLDSDITKHLKNPALFGRAFIRCGGVAWDDDTDIAPEGLYKDGILV